MKDLNPVYEHSIVAENYPSGSTISRINDMYYIMGDDAAEILVLNKKLEEIDRVEIFSKGEELRLPKTSKADVESSVVLVRQSKPAVLFLGSGSLSPHRDSTFIFDPELKKVTRIDTKGPVFREWIIMRKKIYCFLLFLQRIRQGLTMTGKLERVILQY